VLGPSYSKSHRGGLQTVACRVGVGLFGTGPDGVSNPSRQTNRDKNESTRKKRVSNLGKRGQWKEKSQLRRKGGGEMPIASSVFPAAPEKKGE